MIQHTYYTKYFLYTSPTKQLLLNFQADNEKSRKKMTSKKNFRQKISTQIAPPPSANFLMMVSGNFFWATSCF